jgi:hypothetical protein
MKHEIVTDLAEGGEGNLFLGPARHIALKDCGPAYPVFGRRF